MSLRPLFYFLFNCVGGSRSCWSFSSSVYGTSCRVFSSCSSTDSLTEGLNQPTQSPPSLLFPSLHTHTLLTLLFMSLKLHFLNIHNYPLLSAESSLTVSFWLPGHGKDWNFVSEDEGRRRYRHHRRRKRRGGESFGPQSALPTRNTSRR